MRSRCTCFAYEAAIHFPACPLYVPERKERCARNSTPHPLDGCQSKETWGRVSLHPSGLTAESLAKFFHETYEQLAPDFGYETRKESAKPWADVPEKNKRLMIAVCASVITELGVARTSSSGQGSTPNILRSKQK